MLFRTHLALAILLAIIIFPYLHEKIIFLFILFIATLLPDLDLHFFHRKFLHSFTFCLLLTFFLTLASWNIALPFLIGYSLHLLADSFTPQGIKPFWPLQWKIKGKLKTGSFKETVLFYIILLCILIFSILLFVK